MKIIFFNFFNKQFSGYMVNQKLTKDYFKNADNF